MIENDLRSSWDPTRTKSEKKKLLNIIKIKANDYKINRKLNYIELSYAKTETEKLW